MAQSRKDWISLDDGSFLNTETPIEPPREVIDDNGDPPAERPDLGKSERQPGDPETESGRDRTEIAVPNLIGSARGHDAACTRSSANGRLGGLQAGREDDRRTLPLA